MQRTKRFVKFRGSVRFIARHIYGDVVAIELGLGHVGKGHAHLLNKREVAAIVQAASKHVKVVVRNR